MEAIMEERNLSQMSSLVKYRKHQTQTQQMIIHRYCKWMPKHTYNITLDIDPIVYFRWSYTSHVSQV